MSDRRRIARNRLVVIAVLALGIAVPRWAPASASEQAPAAAEQAGTDESAQDADGVCSNVAFTGMIERIRARTRELDRREGELAARERSIAALEQKADQRLERLEMLQKTLDQRLAEFVRDHGDRLDQLAKVYGRMPSKKAAPLVENLGLDLAVHVVTRMKDKQIAALMADLSPPFAVRLSRLVARPLATASFASPDVAAPGRPGGNP